MNPTVTRMLDIYQQAVSRGEEVTLTMEKSGVCLSVRIPSAGGKQVEDDSLDTYANTLNSDHQEDSDRVKKIPENALNKARKLGFSYLFPEHRFDAQSD